MLFLLCKLLVDLDGCFMLLIVFMILNNDGFIIFSLLFFLIIFLCVDEILLMGVSIFEFR